ncbi:MULTISPECIES: type II toxin-antitoxin system ParD family antitoxin [unclassified Moorena]|uniref:type II toxin-antitoxin system ParD family antitoxin n=1 Tax=unclassified Moorena TaxID=2683338 RepID=UPI0013B9FC3F|nr:MULTISPECIES: type II toxin-antitoxin system ParD family antitoxin [unclassified Moorena]NER89324.1 type II toxin-antitoxin system ParD family antitoxin [Moorena sp. SIO3A2]NES40895.1 type II toxin-antitoxin system ParD family antitoxin [Moorena sp. SIO2C4]NES85109.1 type II toxin-antitoxin system ParD family antitoxin [Moorena sp. SIO2B7]
MDTMNIALPSEMKEFIQAQVAVGGYSSASEYIRELIRADQKQKTRYALEMEILKGLSSGDPTPMTAQDWEDIRANIRQRFDQSGK